MDEEHEHFQEQEVEVEIGRPGPSEISDEALKRILEEHEKWLETEGKEGEQADFEGKNIEGISLEEANLERAALANANLRNAFLARINLRNAYLQNAIFENANFFAKKELFQTKGFNPQNEIGKTNLQRARLWRANLRNAYLYGAALQNAEVFEADLQGADLSFALLQGTNLSKSKLRDVQLQDAKMENANLHLADCESADFRKTNLQGSDFSNANLEGANLSLANLKCVNLLETKLRGAILQNADLTGATGLLADQFAQCDVSGAKLPEEFKNFEDSLETVKETSQSAKRIFLAMLLACAYSLLTIFSTGDDKLITNSSSSPLPIIQTGVPIADFYLIAPAILLAIFFYFHLYLQSLWHHLSKLPALFPDGTPLDDKAFPWLLSGLVRFHFPILRNYKPRPPLLSLRRIIATLLAWWSVPFTIAVFWLWYVRAHDWAYTSFHIAFLTISAVSAARFQQLARNTLRHEQSNPIDFRENWKERGTYKWAIQTGHWSSGAALALLALGVSFGAFYGSRTAPISIAIRILGSRSYLDLRDKELSTKPANWERDKALAVLATRATRNNQDNEPTVNRPEAVQKYDEFFLISGAHLEGKDLRYAWMDRAYLVKANFNKANLRGAKLEFTNLQKAKFEKANLREAELHDAYLQGAHLLEAELQGAKINGAEFHGANLKKARLQGVDFSRSNLRRVFLQDAELQDATLENTDLQGAHIRGANLQGADIRDANLLAADLTDAKLQGADFTRAVLQKVNFRRAKLQGANLSLAKLEEADFQDADLSDVNFENAHFKETVFMGANLKGAKLRGAIRLSQDQIEGACVDEKTQLPKGLIRHLNSVACEAW